MTAPSHNFSRDFVNANLCSKTNEIFLYAFSGFFMPKTAFAAGVSSWTPLGGSSLILAVALVDRYLFFFSARTPPLLLAFDLDFRPFKPHCLSAQLPTPISGYAYEISHGD